MVTRLPAEAPSVEDLAIEHKLAQAAESFRFVLDVTPVNVEEQRREFLSGGISEPTFVYRELEDSPEVVGATLDAIDVDAVVDRALRHLLRAKLRELHLQLDMLRARGTSRFQSLSEALYGTVDEALLLQAESILAATPAPAKTGEKCVDAAEFAELAERELTFYRSVEPDINVHVEIRPDVAGVMVSGNVLLVSSATCVRTSRVHALLQHEVGTHLLTHVNGTFQPLRLMATGLAGYEATQEGLAVLAEFLVGGLSTYRLRQIAARVVAVDAMTNGRQFRDVHAALVDHGFSAYSAFTTAMRAFRSGGLTKDAIYLRGLLSLIGHLKSGGSLDRLWLGKLSLDELPQIEDLAERGALNQPRLLPRYLDEPVTAIRLSQAARLSELAELVGVT
ncbi:MAG TPA: tyrosine/phenylalanine carboxypeptidase domain-containing protein [Aeromicrobium sp.]|nr:tyrosine/phenylalanine carboxypeptidase domain-containing protein [Aeromicrobium sp.]